MSFFDSKQEVINIELTSQGKRLLSQGKFKPHFYSFHDDGIIYDAAYYGGAEEPTNAAGRIEDATAVLKPFYSVSTKTGTDAPDVLSIDSFQKENLKLSADPIGTSLPTTNETPQFRCRLLSGKISGSTTITTLRDVATGEVVETLRSPSISMNNLVYRGNFVDEIDSDRTRPAQETIPSSAEMDIFSIRLADDKYLKVKKDYILLSIDEQNTENEFDNFNFAMYVEDATTGEFKQLYHTTRTTNIDEGGFLIENPQEREEEIDNKFLDYYFEISVDSEIDPCEIIEGMPRDQFNQILIEDPLLSLEERCLTPTRVLSRDVDVIPDEDC